jgi:hypothetical protein
VAKLYDKSPARKLGCDDADVLLVKIQAFLNNCRRPAVLDFGDEPIHLEQGRYVLEMRSGRPCIEAWNDERSLSRRVLSLDRTATGMLDCTVQRFGGTTGKLTFLDLDRPQTSLRATRGERQTFGEQFRRMLRREFPGWNIEALSCTSDLRRSFATAFPRAHLKRGNQHLAALACPSLEEEFALLTTALLWFDHLRSRLDRTAQLSLVLFLPESAGNITAHRLRSLTGQHLRTSLYRFNEHGSAGVVDAKDLGNLDTRLNSRYVPAELSRELNLAVSRLRALEGVGCCPEVSGGISICFRGLEFARIERGKIFLGIESKEKVPPQEIARVENFALHLGRLKSSENRFAELAAFPERWFESAVRSHLQTLDSQLLASPVHGQVLTFAGGERELVDLLAVSSSGRLTVLELKTSEDIHLPLQGLDYWMRLAWHADRSEMDSLFPGISILKQPPKLLLVAPAFSFHPGNEIILRYFSPDIEVERIGVNSEWELTLSVAFRLRGADVPISHRGFDVAGLNKHKESDQYAEPS